MNSKNVFFILTLIILSSCGVKGPPLKHPDTVIESYTRNYTKSEPTPEELERTKDKPAIPTALDPQKPLQTPATTKP